MDRWLFRTMVFVSLATCLFGAVKMARADRVDDFKAHGKAEVCTWRANFQARGALGRYHNIPLVFRYVTAQQIGVLMELGEQGREPRDAFYFKGTDLTDHEREFWEENATVGWKSMDATLAVAPETIEPDWDILTNHFQVECMNERDARQYRMLPAASNQRFAAAQPSDARRAECTVKGMEADEILQRREGGQSLESMQAELDATKMTVAQRAEMTEMLLSAYAWTLSPRAFVNKVYGECMR